MHGVLEPFWYTAAVPHSFRFPASTPPTSPLYLNLLLLLLRCKWIQYPQSFCCTSQQRHRRILATVLWRSLNWGYLYNKSCIVNLESVQELLHTTIYISFKKVPVDLIPPSPVQSNNCLLFITGHVPSQFISIFLFLDLGTTFIQILHASFYLTTFLHTRQIPNVRPLYSQVL